MSQAVEGATANLELTDLRRPQTRTQPLPKDRLEAKDCRLRKRLTMIRFSAFPHSPSLTPNSTKILVPGQRKHLPVAMFLDLGIPPGRG
jgi:hypothetical protein